MMYNTFIDTNGQIRISGVCRNWDGGGVGCWMHEAAARKSLDNASLLLSAMPIV